MVSDHKSQYPC